VQRFIDVVFSMTGLLLAGPLIGFFAALIWMQDWTSPFYLAPRAGKSGRSFNMVKLRSMIPNADRLGGDSTPLDDQRITRVGSAVRRMKLDELTQLWNVFAGDMSLVGPRPNTLREVSTYSDREKLLLTVKPGITDFSSIVFSDEGQILSGHDDPDAAYQELIRPFKSRMGIFYVQHQSVALAAKLLFLTLLAAVDRPVALRKVSATLASMGAPADLVAISLRDRQLAKGTVP
jgi:lipopolysaccharide/colanic/teichoic acid biosynthesis glycosyltransferase